MGVLGWMGVNLYCVSKIDGGRTADAFANLPADDDHQHPRWEWPYVGTYLFMSWTADEGLAPLVRLFYYQHEIKTFSQELKIIVTTAYYFALIAITAFGIAEIYKFLVRLSPCSSLARRKEKSPCSRALPRTHWWWPSILSSFSRHSSTFCCVTTATTSIGASSICYPSGFWPAPFCT